MFKVCTTYDSVVGFQGDIYDVQGYIAGSVLLKIHNP